MATRYLNPDLTFDLNAIDADACRAADHAMLRPTAGSDTTWESAYDRAHARYLDLASGHRATELWRIERDAEYARRSALSARERRILDLREAAHLALMIDCTAEAVAVQEAAERELASLGAL